MRREIAPEQTKDLLKSMVIPPCPGILLQLEKEQLQPEPDFNAIAELISADLSLSASVLKTVNSPFFQLSHRIGSVPQALQILGLKNLGNIVRGAMLRSALTPEGSGQMERFWVGAQLTALSSARLAEKLEGVNAEEAYTFGLFRHCGMPLMQARFPSYRATLDKAEELPLAKFVALEESRHQTNHAVVGYLLARTWYLPETLSLAILNHADIRIFDEQDGEAWHAVCTLVAVGALAGHIVKRHLAQNDASDWRLQEPAYLHHLALDRSEYEDLADRITRLLDQY